MTKQKNPVKVIMICPNPQVKKVHVNNATEVPVTGAVNGKGKGKGRPAPKPRASRT